MNNTILATGDLYWRCHKVYRMSLTDELVPAETEWSWRKFKRVEVKAERVKYVISINYSIYNEVTRELENGNHRWSYADEQHARDSFKSVCEQLKAQDPTLRYVDDALESALKGTDD